MDGNYIALIVTLVIWAGLLIVLVRLGKRVKDLEDKAK